MKSLYGEVPLDIVIPNERTSPDPNPNEPEIVGVVTTGRHRAREYRRIGTLSIPSTVESEEK